MELRVTISKPADGAKNVPGFPKAFVVSGAAQILGTPDQNAEAIVLEKVRVTFGGGGGDVKAAQLSGTANNRSWTTKGSVAPTAIGGHTVRLTAVATGRRLVPTKIPLLPGGGAGENTPPPPPHWEDFQQQTSIVVTLEDKLVETVTIDAFTTPASTPKDVPYRLALSGTADDVAGIKSVAVKVDGGKFEPVDAHTVHGTAWTWSKTLELKAGQHRLLARATDTKGNSQPTVSSVIDVREPFEPSPVDQALQPTRYLLELAVGTARSESFVQRYLRAGDDSKTVTPTMLAQRFHQPYDRLTEPAVFEPATRPLPQARIAIEVLRAHLSSPAPAELDQRFRTLAYQSLLVGLGTSYDELRLARTAAPDNRQALADRLGIGRLTVRPDHLDDLLLAPDTVSDDQLEALFGYRSTAPADPLDPRLEAAGVLLWQRAALAAQWRQADEAERDAPVEALPIVDPDIVGEAELRSADADDPARSLWTARSAWIAARLTAIEKEAQKVSDPLARLDRLVATQIGPTPIGAQLDLAALAARDAEGEDIEPELRPLELGLDAFRVLAHNRAALAAGELLESEWQDVFAILLQVHKRREFRAWRHEERAVSLVLSPASFQLDQAAPGPGGQTSSWRAPATVHRAWRQTLQARIAQADALEARYEHALRSAEAQVLPALRDALVAASGQAAPDLTRDLMIDLQESSGEQTTRVEQAIETLQAALFSARAGKLPADGAGANWTIKRDSSGERNFDAEWTWIGSYAGWLAATRVFAYPDNELLPVLYVKLPALDAPTKAFSELINDVRAESRITAQRCRALATGYLRKLREEVTLDDKLQGLALTDERSDGELMQLHDLSESEDLRQQAYRELFWLVPMTFAHALQEARQFQAALDWYRTVYAYHLPAQYRRIYRGLQTEHGISSNYDRLPEWLLKELNPHIFAQQRRDGYTRATIMAIAGCFLAYGDAEFAQNTVETNARARTLYETAADLLALDEAQPEAGPFPPNPLWHSLRQQAESSLGKIHRGLNIAGAVNVALEAGDRESTLPSRYRYATLVERAKRLVDLAQQLEAALLAALEQRDAATYDAMRADNDLQTARVSLTIQDIKVADARTGIQLAALQRRRAQQQEDYFTRQLDDGLNGYEKANLAGLGVAAFLQTSAATLYGVGAMQEAFKSSLTAGLFGSPGEDAGQALSALAAAATTGAQIAQTLAAYERREQEWRLQRSLAHTDGEIGDEQIRLAHDQLLLADQERSLAGLQFDHTRAVVDFLARKFTNAELFEWMSGVLGRVYAYFLQQATALAQLAEAQLAFERQEPISGFVKADYWRDTAGSDASASANGTADRRGLTGSARLLQDIYRLDEYAFETDRRKLHISQTLSLAELAAVELQRLRETGVLAFATPEALFDRDFPGHYLRLIRRVRLSLVALIPPTRGVRATLAASGVSRAVVARGPFATVTMRREPEAIALTAPIDATGLFELEPENGMLLPFEGMGVDTRWQLELPKAANPFDYRSIADVMLTIEYTALNDLDYRQVVIRSLDGRFSGDRAFSLRNQFPDVWYELNNPETVDDPQRRMRATLPLTRDDFPPHIRDLSVAQLTLFAVRDSSLHQELSVPALRHVMADGQTVEADGVQTIGGVVGTRRPGGAPWQSFIGVDPAGDWELQLDDSDLMRGWFTDGLIEDLVLVFTLAGGSPPW